MVKRIPKQNRAVEKKASIIRTMRRVLEEEKYAQTSTHRIASLSGVGVGTLYEYFDSKEDILLALLEHQTEQVWARLESALQTWPQAPAEARLSRFFEFVIDLALGERAVVRVLFGQVPGILQQDCVVRLLSKVEAALSLMLLAQRPDDQPRLHAANVFLLQNALLGIALGIANGLPPSITRDHLCERMRQLAAAASA